MRSRFVNFRFGATNSVQLSEVANLIGAELSLRQVLMLVTWIGCQILTCLFFGGSNPSMLVCVLLFLVLCVNFLCKFVSVLSINHFFMRAFDLFASIFFALSLTVTSFFANFSLLCLFVLNWDKFCTICSWMFFLICSWELWQILYFDP